MSENITSLTDEVASNENCNLPTTIFSYDIPPNDETLDLAASLENDLDNLPANTDTVCKYFIQGMCRFGGACRFIHHSVDEIETSNAIGLQVLLNATPVEIESESASSSTIKIVKDTKAEANITKVQLDPASWVQAPEFIPKTQPIPSTAPKSYAQILGTNSDSKQIIKFDTASCSSDTERTYLELATQNPATPLCPFYFDGRTCRNETQCPYVHGLKCEYCNLNCLHPTDMDQQAVHKNACIKQHQDDMELSFAVARSKDKTCGICFEIIMEKSGREQRFGILPNCNHIFCLQCIRTWRQAKQFENKIIRACPECRVTSDFICPSIYWFDTKDEKEQLIANYQVALKEKDCKYFKKGYGVCPFGNKCFYKHALPNGTTIDVGMPQRKILRQNHLGDADILQQIFLWDFLADHDWQLLDDLATIIRSDSSESDWSD